MRGTGHDALLPFVGDGYFVMLVLRCCGHYALLQVLQMLQMLQMLHVLRVKPVRPGRPGRERSGAAGSNS